MNGLTDPRWLDFIKLSGWKTCAIAFGLGVFILLIKFGFLSEPQSWIYHTVWAIFLLSISLCLLTIIEFCYRNFLSIFVSNWMAYHPWEKKIKSLSENARKLLALVENDSLDTFYYLPQSPEIAELRNSDIIYSIIISNDGEKWGQFRLNFKYETAYKKNRSDFRLLLKYSHADSENIRKIMADVRYLASGRI